jgi:tetratricopeptide (TPR) repeat protein
MRVLLFCLFPLAALTVAAHATNDVETADRAAGISSASVPAVKGTNDPVEAEFKRLMLADDAAMDEVDQWIRENEKFKEHGAGTPDEALNARIQRRFEPVRRGYEEFIQKNPNHGRARLAFASFLEETGDEAAALEQMLKAKEVEPGNPAVWNNLANYYGHRSPVTNAFTHYEKAIELDPKEPVYYQNFGTTVFLFRKDAMEHYGITEQQVFDKALTLYSNAVALDPNNFLLATDVAMTFYGIKPPRTDEAIAAWERARALAADDLQREGVEIHLARTKLQAGRLAEARAHLETVKHESLQELKRRVLRNVEAQEKPATDASAPPATAPPE